MRPVFVVFPEPGFEDHISGVACVGPFFCHPPSNLFKVSPKLLGSNVGPGRLGQDLLKQTLQFVELDQVFAQHKDDVFEIRFKPARDLAQRDAVRVKNIDLQLAEPPDGASSLAGIGWQRDEFSQGHVFQVQPHLGGQRC